MSKKSKKKAEILAYKRKVVDYYCTNCEPIEFFSIEDTEYAPASKLLKLACPFCGKKSKVVKMDD